MTRALPPRLSAGYGVREHPSCGQRRRDPARQRASATRSRASLSTRRRILSGPFREQVEQATPATRGTHRCLHRRGGVAVPLEGTVLEIDSGRAVRLRGEAHLHFTGLCEVWFVFPVAANLPGQDKTARRLKD